MSENAATMEQTAMMPKHGQVCWTEIATKNLDACKQFYAELFGWNLKRSEAVGEEVEYIEFGTEENCMAGGMYQMTEECGEAPSHWMSYVAVDDVDESAKKVVELGGNVCVPPSDIPNVGRFSVITDPTGATFSIITLKPCNPA